MDNYKVHYSTYGSAKCRQWGQQIVKNEIRFGVKVSLTFRLEYIYILLYVLQAFSRNIFKRFCGYVSSVIWQRNNDYEFPQSVTFSGWLQKIWKTTKVSKKNRIHSMNENDAIFLVHLYAKPKELNIIKLNWANKIEKITR